MSRLISRTTLAIITGVYLLSVLIVTFYWARHWSIYTHYKGDELFFLAEYLLAGGFLFYLLQIIFIKQLKYLTLILIPFGTVFTTFILGMLFLAISGIAGTTTQTIYVYGIIYGFTNIILTIFITNRSKKL